MKIKVTEASGKVLDWMVCVAAGWSPCVGYDEDGEQCVMLGNDEQHPSDDWAQGGPIIDCEGITTRAIRREGHKINGQWLAMYDGSNTGSMVQWVKRTDWPRHYLSGPTPLIAAMRCYVASKLGEEVEVPDELW